MKAEPEDILLSRLDGHEIDLMAWQGAVEQTFLIDTQEIDRVLMATNLEVVVEGDEEDRCGVG